MPFRVSMRFTQPVGDRTAGWSENFWNVLADIPSVDTAAFNFAYPLYAVHGNGVNLPNWRISDANTFRNVFNHVIGLSSAVDPSPTIQDADYPTSALLLKLTGVGGYVTRQWIKGIQDSVVSRAGQYLPRPAYVTLMNTVFSFLTNAANGWAMRVSDRTVPFKPVKDISQAGIVTITGHGYNDNSRVRISRVKGLTQANRVWRITRIDADTFSLQGWVAPATTTPYLGNGLARQVVPIFVSIQQAIIERATKHNVGRPFGVLTGRRRRKAS